MVRILLVMLFCYRVLGWVGVWVAFENLFECVGSVSCLGWVVVDWFCDLVV